jgi:glycosyltransferase involved in cell wall biosynthesis
VRLAFISTYPPAACGIASYTRELASGLKACDPSLRIEVVTEHGAWRAGDGHVWPSFDRDDDYAAPILARVDAIDPDVIHIQHEYGVFGLDDRFHDLLAGLRRRDQTVVVTLHTVHTKLSMDLGCSWRDRRPPSPDLDIERYQVAVGAAVDAVVVHQEEAIRQVLLRQGLAEERVVTIPHGTPPFVQASKAAARTSLGIPLDRSLLVAFGYFEPAKNHAVLIEAMSLLRESVPTARLLVGGHIRHLVPQTVSYRARCEQLVSQLGLDSQVAFLDDPVPDNEVANLLAAADVGCFVYDEDTRSSSGALRWAIAGGVPFVASRIAKFAEVAEICDELLVNPRSPLQIARLVERILSDEVFQDRVRERGKSFAQATSWQHVARRHLALYRDVTERAATQRLVASRPPDNRYAAAVT